ERIAAAAQPIEDPERCDLSPLLDRIGDARVVCIGEASHGSSEFYRFRARITRELIEHHGFDLIAVEADWPDASRIDHYVRDLTTPPGRWTAFTRFPTWMWRNQEVRDFVEWLRTHNAAQAPEQRVGFHGLDLYSLSTSIAAVLQYLDDVDPDTAQIARERYACLTPWQSDPTSYARAAASGRLTSCEDEVAAMLRDLLEKRIEQALPDGDRLLDAVQNARLVADAERYYRSMFRGYPDSWNLRDQHMFETAQTLMQHRGPQARMVIWAHNSHLGDARATEMSLRGEFNLGQLCREHWGEATRLIGFGTDHGTVAAADDWDGPMRVKQVRPALSDSWEGMCHKTRMAGFLLGIRDCTDPALLADLHANRLERAIGVIYRPQTERASHYFQSELGAQFDEYVWFDETHAVTPLDSRQLHDVPETYPFGV
ncbi:MAG: erythromycin esterase family protein, partial [Planctomycetota bacterium]